MKQTRLGVVLSGLLMVLGCATSPVDESIDAPVRPYSGTIVSPFIRNSPAPAPARAARRAPAATRDEVRTSQAMPVPARETRIRLAGVPIENTDFDFPVREHAMVDQWAKYFLGRGREQFEKYLTRSEYMVPEILPILRSKGLPEDLIYLSLIESGFSFHAESHASAVGPWQFISSTGKLYGLKINWWTDERRNLHRSTEAAARYLGDLYHRFGSWELAAAAYNAGEARVNKAIRRAGTRDYWRLVKGRYLPEETRNYVPKIMAAAMIGKNRRQFGFSTKYAVDRDEIWRSPSFETEVPGPVDLLKVARAAGLSYAEVKRLNPHLLRWCSDPAASKVRVRLPAQIKRKFLDTYLHPAYSRDVVFREYSVRAGDTLSRIARRFGLRVEPIQQMNGIRRHQDLIAGRRILLPLPADRGFELAEDVGSPGEPADEPKEAVFAPVDFKDRAEARAESYVEGI